MTQVVGASFSESERMELRALILLASEIISYYWPMRTFVHHNPLHGLEGLPFEEAVGQAQRLLGGNGYLPNETFRAYFRSGRILPQHLDAALKPHAGDERISLGAAPVSRLDALRVHLTQGISAPPADTLDAAVEFHPERTSMAALADRLSSALLPSQSALAAEELRGPNGSEALSAWCDRVFGTQIVEQINRELIKWCEAFLDEGHATWPMPGREKGFYAAWKLLAQKEWSPCGIRKH